MLKRLGLVASCALLAGWTGSPPVLDSITLRTDTSGQYMVVYPEFHFHAPDGNVTQIDRELLSTDMPNSFKGVFGQVELPVPFGFNPTSRILNDSNSQVHGATYVGGWRCGPNSYYMNARAKVVTDNGLSSNWVNYTIHCNGG